MLKRCDGALVPGRLVYRRAEHSFDVEPRPTAGVSSLLVNDVQIEVDEDGCLMYAWGFCPQESWSIGVVDQPEAIIGRLQYVETIIPGVSKRLNPHGRWPTTHDPRS